MSNEELASEFENFGNEMMEVDIYDLKYCNESCMNFNVEDELDKIKARTLIIACKQDPHFPPELDAIPMNNMIEGSELIIMDSDLGHLCFNELESISSGLKEFMGSLMIVNITDFGQKDDKNFVEYEVSQLLPEHLDYLKNNLTEEVVCEGDKLIITMYFDDNLYPFQSETAQIRLEDFIAREEIEMNVFLSGF